MFNVRFLKPLITAIALPIFVTACSRPVADKNSRLVIKAPNSEKVGALALPANRKACWGANVTGSGINGASATSCSPATGVVAGYKVSGETITAEVAKGPARKIDLYVFLLAAGDNSACPVMTASFPNSQLTSTYLVGSTVADFTLETTEVEITANFTGEANNLAASAAMPAVCTAVSSAPVSPSRLTAAVGRTSGDGYTINARVGTYPGAKTTAGDGIAIKVK